MTLKIAFGLCIQMLHYSDSLGHLLEPNRHPITGSIYGKGLTLLKEPHLPHGESFGTAVTSEEFDTASGDASLKDSTLGETLVSKIQEIEAKKKLAMKLLREIDERSKAQIPQNSATTTETVVVTSADDNPKFLLPISEKGGDLGITDRGETEVLNASQTPIEYDNIVTVPINLENQEYSKIPKTIQPEDILEEARSEYRGNESDENENDGKKKNLMDPKTIKPEPILEGGRSQCPGNGNDGNEDDEDNKKLRNPKTIQSEGILEKSRLECPDNGGDENEDDGNNKKLRDGDKYGGDKYGGDKYGGDKYEASRNQGDVDVLIFDENGGGTEENDVESVEQKDDSTYIDMTTPINEAKKKKQTKKRVKKNVSKSPKKKHKNSRKQAFSYKTTVATQDSGDQPKQKNGMQNVIERVQRTYTVEENPESAVQKNETITTVKDHKGLAVRKIESVISRHFNPKTSHLIGTAYEERLYDGKDKLIGIEQGVYNMKSIDDPNSSEQKDLDKTNKIIKVESSKRSDIEPASVNLIDNFNKIDKAHDVANNEQVVSRTVNTTAKNLLVKDYDTLEMPINSPKIVTAIGEDVKEDSSNLKKKENVLFDELSLSEIDKKAITRLYGEKLLLNLFSFEFQKLYIFILFPGIIVGIFICYNYYMKLKPSE